MKILVAALHAGYYRNLEPVIEELAARGHDIYLGSERHASALGGEKIVERLALLPNVTHGEVPRREKDSFFLASKIRLALDYLRYLEPAYRATDTRTVVASLCLAALASASLTTKYAVFSVTGASRWLHLGPLSGSPAPFLIGATGLLVAAWSAAPEASDVCRPEPPDCRLALAAYRPMQPQLSRIRSPGRITR